jgi:baculoviral IAP repeat-containing protein 6
MSHTILSLNEIDDICKQLKYIKLLNQSKERLTFSLNTQKFTIVIPPDPDGVYIIENQILLDDFKWMSRLNEYILDKMPALQKLLEYIETKYEREKKNTPTNMNNFLNMPDLKVSQFDISEQKYKYYLECKLNSVKSNFNMTSEKNVPVLFSGNLPGYILIGEFFKFRKEHASNNRIELSLNNDNIYTWTVRFNNFSNTNLNNQLKSLRRNFGYDYIEIEIQFHDKLYPNYPPFVRAIRPRLEKSLMNRITNMKMVQLEYWTPTRSMNYIISKLYDALDKHGEIDFESEMNDIKKYPTGSYHHLESILIKLASLCDIVDEHEPLDTEKYKNIMELVKPKAQKSITTSNKSSAIWGSGTGYGHGSSNNWNPEEYIELQKEKDRQIQTVINTLIDVITSVDNNELLPIYKILESSYMIPFIKSYIRGTNMLDMSKHIDMYKILFGFLQLLVTQQSIYLFNDRNSEITLYDMIFSLYKEAQQTIKLVGKSDDTSNEGDIATMVCTLYEMIKPVYDEYIELHKKQIEEDSLKWKKKIDEAKSSDDPIKLQYVKNMKDLNFDQSKFSNFSNCVLKADNTSAKPSMVRHLAKEYASMLNSLPIFYESSIFVRVNVEDTRQVKVLITGPDNTPYDSGCFIFDLYTGSDYPNTLPKMLFVNHGGKRFNPNLYESGKVCLSLLGTWNGNGGESWNPKTSTLQQLFISIQAQILVSQPFYNEPGYETRYNNPEGRERSREYSNERRYYTMLHAMYDLVYNPKAYPEFEDIIIKHFSMKKEYIKTLCQKWCSEPNNKYDKLSNAVATKLLSVLDKF